METITKNFKKSKSTLYRVKTKIKKIIETNKAYFLTLTFNNETLKNTNKQTRKSYILKWLKNNFVLYIANVDYGTKNDREHYHAIATKTTYNFKNLTTDTNEIKINNESFKYGFIYAKRIHIEKNNKEQLKFNVDRLFNHFYKTTNNLIFNRSILSRYKQKERIKEEIKQIEETKQNKKELEFFNKYGLFQNSNSNDLRIENQTNNIDAIIQKNINKEILDNYNKKIINFAISEYTKINKVEKIKKLSNQTLIYESLKYILDIYGDWNLLENKNINNIYLQIYYTCLYN